MYTMPIGNGDISMLQFGTMQHGACFPYLRQNGGQAFRVVAPSHSQPFSLNFACRKNAYKHKENRAFYCRREYRDQAV